MRAFVSHLRLPFQLVLAPIFLLGWWSAATEPPAWVLVVSFLAVHVGLYGGTTVYNSFYDRDEGPISFLKEPMPLEVSHKNASLALQWVSAAVLAFIDPMAGAIAAVMVVMGICYSHPRPRWKARTWAAIAAVAVGQGAGAVLLGWAVAGDGSIPPPLTLKLALAATLVTVGVYPLTQVYQVREDGARGDRTIAVRYGWKPAMAFACVVSTAGCWALAASLASHSVLAPLIAAAPLALLLAIAVWSRRFEQQDEAQNHDWAVGISGAAALGFWAVWLSLPALP